MWWWSTVEADAVTVTYTDVHLARAQFFTGLFDGFRRAMERARPQERRSGLGDDGVFYLVTGRLTPPTTRRATRFLEAVGARARVPDRLEQGAQGAAHWVGKATTAVRVLDWAARHALRPSRLPRTRRRRARRVRRASCDADPHRLRRTARPRARARRGGRFPQDGAARSAEALLEGGSVRLARDRIEAELVRHLQRVRQHA